MILAKKTLKPKIIIMRNLFILIALIISNSSFAQNKDIIIKSEKKDSITYNIIIINNSDSILCLLTSVFLSHTKECELAIYDKTDNQIIYSLNYLIEDSRFDSALPIYRAECIFPNQTLFVSIKITKYNEKYKKSLRLNFFYKKNLCYKSFNKEIHKRNWVKNYTLFNRNIILL